MTHIDHKELRPLTPAHDITEVVRELSAKLDVFICTKAENTTPSAMNLILLSNDEVCNLTGLSRQQINKMTVQGDFPKPKNLVGRRIAWPLQDYADWVESRPYIA